MLKNAINWLVIRNVWWMWPYIYIPGCSKCFGIVKVETKYWEIKFYGGYGDGVDEDKDIETIVRGWGLFYPENIK